LLVNAANGLEERQAGPPDREKKGMLVCRWKSVRGKAKRRGRCG